MSNPEEEQKQTSVQSAEHNSDPYFKQGESLTILDLNKRRIGTKGAIAISENTTWTNLNTLNLTWNNIDAEGASALSKNSTWTNLNILNLKGNEIGPEGAIALSKNTTWTNLTTLGLGENKIGAGEPVHSATTPSGPTLAFSN